ncbi:MAG TPA: alpha-amylase family glycosyl hydrolase, partial [Labilithrix sp.]|nr:alpha-amylase family glycosyl hydrolase [Labilithrix sp.]
MLPTRLLRSLPLAAALLAVACGSDSADPEGQGGSQGGPGAPGGPGLPGAPGDAKPPPAFLPPFGAWFDGDTMRFRARSANATRLEVSLFAEAVGAAKLTVVLSRTTGSDVWEGAAPLADVRKAGVTAAVYYGYRAWGPNWTYTPSWKPGAEAGFVADVDGAGNRFNPNKLLIDPYAREVSHDPVVPGRRDGSIYAVGPANRTKDSAPLAPTSIVLPTEGLDKGTKPARAFKDDIVYEVHLRGLTRGDASLGECAGTYQAAMSRVPYLKALGVTAIELLPVQETQNDTNDLEVGTGGDNYWGYSTLAYLAPERRYACDRSPGGPTRELAAMVKSFHDADIKVFVDVVYNHTAEGGGSSLLSLRGMDNASYYELADDAGRFADNTGIGANVNVTSDMARGLIVDSLKYWSEQLGVDGFRFDLAAVLGNSCKRGCFSYDKGDARGVLQRAHSELPGVPLIAEPWGIGNGTYQLGNFPAGWSEWNGQFRDVVRAAQNQIGAGAPTPGVLSNVLSGSSNLYADDGRTPAASVNFLVSHDGFTLRDVYSCNGKNNGQPWPYGPSDGGEDNNHSWDHGGDQAAQRQAVRTGLALLMVSSGVPMITGGDELHRTLRCNNNGYNLDSPANWIDWKAA